MAGLFLNIAFTVLMVILSFFFVYRLRLGHNRGAGGVGLIYTGLVLMFLFAIMNLVRQHPDYHEWFLESIYPVIIIINFIILAGGLISFVIGIALYFSYWGDRITEMDIHLNKLKLLENLQQENQTTYPLGEMLQRTLKTLLGALNEEAGAVLLYKPSDKEYELVSSVGLSEKEKPMFQGYKFGRNIISESVEYARPLLTSDFRRFGGKAQIALSKFRSLLVVPLVSGRVRLGVILFISSREHHYTDEFLSIVSPIADWLSKYIDLYRLSRELKHTREELEIGSANLEDFCHRVGKLFKPTDEIVSPSSFANTCLGLFDTDEVWLVGLTDDHLVVHGGTSGKSGFTDNFESALTDALSKGKAITLNQQGTGKSGQSHISKSSVLHPIDKDGNAILLRKKNSIISITKGDIRLLDVVVKMAGMVIKNATAGSLGEARYKGLEVISHILSVKIPGRRIEDNLNVLMDELAATASEKAILLLYRCNENRLEAVSCNVKSNFIKDIVISFGEGSGGKAAVLKIPEAVFGGRNVSRNLNHYNEKNRNLFNKLFGDRGDPIFQADYPIVINNRVEYLITLFDFDGFPGGYNELHQLLSILSGLFNLRMEVSRVGLATRSTEPELTGESMAILAIADQTMILDLLESMCQSIGFEVLTAVNGREGLNLFKTKQPDIVIIDSATRADPQELIITDLAKQGLSAWELATRIKQISPKTPVIALTGWGIAVDEEKMKESGVDAILPKPFQFKQFSELISKLKKLIKKS